MRGILINKEQRACWACWKVLSRRNHWTFCGNGACIGRSCDVDIPVVWRKSQRWVGTDTAILMGMPWALLGHCCRWSRASWMLCTTRSAATCCGHFLRTMSNILELNCWVIGDNPRHVIPVEVPSSKTIGYLKKEIKNEIEHSFADLRFDAKSLDLESEWSLITHSTLLY